MRGAEGQDCRAWMRRLADEAFGACRFRPGFCSDTVAGGYTVIASHRGRFAPTGWLAMTQN
jgi:hypothetical protein